jgi:methylglutaconyl-CoA hydratase
MSDGEDVVLLNTTRAGVAVVTLNRPKVHNAFNPQVIEKLSDIFETLRGADNVRVVMIDGAGPSFSAGADLAWMRAAADYSKTDNREDAGGMAEMLHRLHTLPQVTIALVHGAAMAGGCGILSACDMAIATKTASFALSEVRLGIIPAVISPYVIRAIGARAAHRYFLTAERFDAATAHALGLVHILVDDNDALAKACEPSVHLRAGRDRGGERTDRGGCRASDRQSYPRRHVAPYRGTAGKRRGEGRAFGFPRKAQAEVGGIAR